MLRYMLDTDTCAYIMKRKSDVLLKRLQRVPLEEVCVSVITKAELLYGVEVSPRREQDEAAVHAFLNYVETLDFPDQAASHYADIRSNLKHSGRVIGANDLLIAAHARGMGLTLITNITKEFGRVRNLKLENWTTRS